MDRATNVSSSFCKQPECCSGYGKPQIVNYSIEKVLILAIIVAIKGNIVPIYFLEGVL